MYNPLSSVVRRAPVWCPPGTSLRAALAKMREVGIGSMIVADPQTREPLGIFTLHDLLDRVVLEQCDLEQPIERVMTSPVVTLEPQVSAYEAAVTMAHHGLRHVVIVERRRLAGVVSQKDLFNLQRLGATEIGSVIRAATDLESLKQAVRDIRELSRNMLESGIGAEPLTQLVSALNDHLTIRIIELVRARHTLPQGRLCWLALGSEGRYEQTISTDQDNAIIFDAPERAAAELRRTIVPFAREVNEALDACGFPLCRGGVMAGNPPWCLSREEWRQQCQRWIDAQSPEALLNAVIFFDFRPLWGETALAEELREWLVGTTTANPLFMFQMAQLALGVRSPLGILRTFVYDSKEFPHTIDLKAHGTRLLVDAARVYALANGVSHTNTVQRLRLVAEKIGLGASEVEAAVQAFNFLQLLRLRSQLDPDVKPGAENRVDPATLNYFDRRFLKESLRQAQTLRRRLELDYHTR
ncbi:MAG: DUF294 nucleotidyltransferase-like domain-containing protein [Burkholderiales bacterium]|nr:DUF294 nucleotidyltransferase-like domain-containing protein [Burkholderiales bacterium]